MRTLNASAVSIIVLATSLQKQRDGGQQYSHFFDRAVPMKSTWAHVFDVELAFGTNVSRHIVRSKDTNVQVFDNNFLLSNCEELKDRRRQLRITNPQAPSRDVVERFKCQDSYFRSSLRSVQHTCSDEFLAAGFTCYTLRIAPVSHRPLERTSDN